MKKRKKKNAITLLALVITIVIMLLLAGVAIQMTMGENGLIAKSVQAQKEQAKAELYDTAKLSYMSLNAKALENGQPSPQAELALSTTEFTNKYNVVGDNIQDKNGYTIESKTSIINTLKELYPKNLPNSKTIAGVTIPAEDKDKFILKLKVNSPSGNYNMSIGRLFLYADEPVAKRNIMTVDFGNGQIRELTDQYIGEYVNYSNGEYILKFENISDLGIGEENSEDYELEVLQWGKILEYDYNFIELNNVSKIYEPEPDNIVIRYQGNKLKEIPEWLFSKKINSKRSSIFKNCREIQTIPDNLFDNCNSMISFNSVFNGCSGLTHIPQKIINKILSATDNYYAFSGCINADNYSSLPNNLKGE